MTGLPCHTRDLDWETHNAQLWDSSRADIDLQALMQQSGGPKTAVTLFPVLHKVGLDDSILDVLVSLAMLGDGQVRDGLITALRRVVMASPDLRVVGQGEQLLCRLEQSLGAAAWKVAASGANVGVEE
jgi:hypothetical protein